MSARNYNPQKRKVLTSSGYAGIVVAIVAIAAIVGIALLVVLPLAEPAKEAPRRIVSISRVDDIGLGSSPDSIMVRVAYDRGEPEEIALSGMVCEGLDVNSLGEQSVSVRYGGFEDVISVNVRRIDCKLVYRASEGGRIEGDAEQHVLSGQDASTVRAIPETGYKFSGWNDGYPYAERKDTVVYDSYDESNPLMATFDKEEFEVVFFFLDGTAMKPQKVKYGERAAAPDHFDPKMRVYGYTFDGWSIEDDELSRITHDTEIRPQYRKTATEVSVDLTLENDGKTPMGETDLNKLGYYPYGNTVMITAKPNNGRKFNYWSVFRAKDGEWVDIVRESELGDGESGAFVEKEVEVGDNGAKIAFRVSEATQDRCVISFFCPDAPEGELKNGVDEIRLRANFAYGASRVEFINYQNNNKGNLECFVEEMTKDETIGEKMRDIKGVGGRAVRIDDGEGGTGLPVPDETPGLTFVGWYAQGEAEQRLIDRNRKFARDASVAAKWAKKLYTVRFVAQESEDPAVPPRTVGEIHAHYQNTLGSGGGIPAEIPTRKMYRFAGWADKLTGEIAHDGTQIAKRAQYDQNDDFAERNAIVMIARWEPIRHELRVETKGEGAVRLTTLDANGVAKETIDVFGSRSIFENEKYEIAFCPNVGHRVKEAIWTRGAETSAATPPEGAEGEHRIALAETADNSFRVEFAPAMRKARIRNGEAPSSGTVVTADGKGRFAGVEIELEFPALSNAEFAIVPRDEAHPLERIFATGAAAGRYFENEEICDFSRDPKTERYEFALERIASDLEITLVYANPRRAIDILLGEFEDSGATIARLESMNSESGTPIVAETAHIELAHGETAWFEIEAPDGRCVRRIVANGIEVDPCSRGENLRFYDWHANGEPLGIALKFVDGEYLYGYGAAVVGGVEYEYCEPVENPGEGRAYETDGFVRSESVPAGLKEALRIAERSAAESGNRPKNVTKVRVMAIANRNANIGISVAPIRYALDVEESSTARILNRDEIPEFAHKGQSASIVAEAAPGFAVAGYSINGAETRLPEPIGFGAQCVVELSDISEDKRVAFETEEVKCAIVFRRAGGPERGAIYVSEPGESESERSELTCERLLGYGASADYAIEASEGMRISSLRIDGEDVALAFNQTRRVFSICDCRRRESVAVEVGCEELEPNEPRDGGYAITGFDATENISGSAEYGEESNALTLIPRERHSIASAKIRGAKGGAAKIVDLLSLAGEGAAPGLRVTLDADMFDAGTTAVVSATARAESFDIEIVNANPLGGTCVGPSEAEYGSRIAIEANANANHRIASFRVNGEEVPVASGNWTTTESGFGRTCVAGAFTTRVGGPMKIEADFRLFEYDVALVGRDARGATEFFSGAAYSTDGRIRVPHGHELGIRMKADPGHHIAGVYANGSRIDWDSPAGNPNDDVEGLVEIESVVRDTDIRVDYAINRYSVECELVNGSLNFADERGVENRVLWPDLAKIPGEERYFGIAHGNNFSFRVVPDIARGYYLHSARIRYKGEERERKAGDGVVFEGGGDIWFNRFEWDNPADATGVTADIEKIEFVFKKRAYALEILQEPSADGPWGGRVELSVKDGTIAWDGATETDGIDDAAPKYKFSGDCAYLIGATPAGAVRPVRLSDGRWAFADDADGDGRIDEGGRERALRFESGTNATIAFRPDAGYRRDSMTFNGQDRDKNVYESGKYPFAIVGATEIATRFELIEHRIEIGATAYDDKSKEVESEREGEYMRIEAFRIEEDGTRTRLELSPSDAGREACAARFGDRIVLRVAPNFDGTGEFERFGARGAYLAYGTKNERPIPDSDYSGDIFSRPVEYPRVEPVAGEAYFRAERAQALPGDGRYADPLPGFPEGYCVKGEGDEYVSATGEKPVEGVAYYKKTEEGGYALAISDGDGKYANPLPGFPNGYWEATGAEGERRYARAVGAAPVEGKAYYVVEYAPALGGDGKYVDADETPLPDFPRGYFLRAGGEGTAESSFIYVPAEGFAVESDFEFAFAIKVRKYEFHAGIEYDPDDPVVGETLNRAFGASTRSEDWVVGWNESAAIDLVTGEGYRITEIRLKLSGESPEDSAEIALPYDSVESWPGRWGEFAGRPRPTLETGVDDIEYGKKDVLRFEGGASFGCRATVMCERLPHFLVYDPAPAEFMEKIVTVVNPDESMFTSRECVSKPSEPGSTVLDCRHYDRIEARAYPKDGYEMTDATARVESGAFDGSSFAPGIDAEGRPIVKEFALRSDVDEDGSIFWHFSFCGDGGTVAEHSLDSDARIKFGLRKKRYAVETEITRIDADANHINQTEATIEIKDDSNDWLVTDKGTQLQATLSPGSEPTLEAEHFGRIYIGFDAAPGCELTEFRANGFELEALLSELGATFEQKRTTDELGRTVAYEYAISLLASTALARGAEESGPTSGGVIRIEMTIEPIRYDLAVAVNGKIYVPQEDGAKTSVVDDDATIKVEIPKSVAHFGAVYAQIDLSEGYKHKAPDADTPRTIGAPLEPGRVLTDAERAALAARPRVFVGAAGALEGGMLFAFDGPAMKHADVSREWDGIAREFGAKKNWICFVFDTEIKKYAQTAFACLSRADGDEFSAEPLSRLSDSGWVVKVKAGAAETLLSYGEGAAEAHSRVSEYFEKVTISARTDGSDYDLCGIYELKPDAQAGRGPHKWEKAVENGATRHDEFRCANCGASPDLAPIANGKDGITYSVANNFRKVEYVVRDDGGRPPVGDRTFLLDFRQKAEIRLAVANPYRYVETERRYAAYAVATAYIGIGEFASGAGVEPPANDARAAKPTSDGSGVGLELCDVYAFSDYVGKYLKFDVKDRSARRLSARYCAENVRDSAPLAPIRELESDGKGLRIMRPSLTLYAYVDEPGTIRARVKTVAATDAPGGTAVLKRPENSNERAVPGEIRRLVVTENESHAFRRLRIRQPDAARSAKLGHIVFDGGESTGWRDFGRDAFGAGDEDSALAREDGEAVAAAFDSFVGRNNISLLKAARVGISGGRRRYEFEFRLCGDAEFEAEFYRTYELTHGILLTDLVAQYGKRAIYGSGATVAFDPNLTRDEVFGRDAIGAESRTHTLSYGASFTIEAAKPPGDYQFVGWYLGWELFRPEGGRAFRFRNAANLFAQFESMCPTDDCLAQSVTLDARETPNLRSGDEEPKKLELYAVFQPVIEVMAYNEKYYRFGSHFNSWDLGSVIVGGYEFERPVLDPANPKPGRVPSYEFVDFVRPDASRTIAEAMARLRSSRVVKDGYGTDWSAIFSEFGPEIPESFANARLHAEFKEFDTLFQTISNGDYASYSWENSHVMLQMANMPATARFGGWQYFDWKEKRWRGIEYEYADESRGMDESARIDALDPDYALGLEALYSFGADSANALMPHALSPDQEFNQVLGLGSYFFDEEGAFAIDESALVPAQRRPLLLRPDLYQSVSVRLDQIMYSNNYIGEEYCLAEGASDSENAPRDWNLSEPGAEGSDRYFVLNGGAYELATRYERGARLFLLASVDDPETIPMPTRIVAPEISKIDGEALSFDREFPRAFLKDSNRAAEFEYGTTIGLCRNRDKNARVADLFDSERKTRYRFLGWFLKRDGELRYMSDSELEPDGEFELRLICVANDDGMFDHSAETRFAFSAAYVAQHKQELRSYNVSGGEGDEYDDSLGKSSFDCAPALEFRASGAESREFSAYAVDPDTLNISCDPETGRYAERSVERFYWINGADEADCPRKNADGADFSETGRVMSFFVDAGMKYRIYPLETAGATSLDEVRRYAKSGYCPAVDTPYRVALNPSEPAARRLLIDYPKLDDNGYPTDFYNTGRGVYYDSDEEKCLTSDGMHYRFLADLRALSALDEPCVAHGKLRARRSNVYDFRYISVATLIFYNLTHKSGITLSEPLSLALTRGRQTRLTAWDEMPDYGDYLEVGADGRPIPLGANGEVAVRVALRCAPEGYEGMFKAAFAGMRNGNGFPFKKAFGDCDATNLSDSPAGGQTPPDSLFRSDADWFARWAEIDVEKLCDDTFLFGHDVSGSVGVPVVRASPDLVPSKAKYATDNCGDAKYGYRVTSVAQLKNIDKFWRNNGESCVGIVEPRLFRAFAPDGSDMPAPDKKAKPGDYSDNYRLNYGRAKFVLTEERYDISGFSGSGIDLTEHSISGMGGTEWTPLCRSGNAPIDDERVWPAFDDSNEAPPGMPRMRGFDGILSGLHPWSSSTPSEICDIAFKGDHGSAEGDASYAVKRANGEDCVALGLFAAISGGVVEKLRIGDVFIQDDCSGNISDFACGALAGAIEYSKIQGIDMTNGGRLLAHSGTKISGSYAHASKYISVMRGSCVGFLAGVARDSLIKDVSFSLGSALYVAGKEACGAVLGRATGQDCELRVISINGQSKAIISGFVPDDDSYVMGCAGGVVGELSDGALMRGVDVYGTHPGAPGQFDRVDLLIGCKGAECAGGIVGRVGAGARLESSKLRCQPGSREISFGPEGTNNSGPYAFAKECVGGICGENKEGEISGIAPDFMKGNFKFVGEGRSDQSKISAGAIAGRNSGRIFDIRLNPDNVKISVGILTDGSSSVRGKHNVGGLVGTNEFRACPVSRFEKTGDEYSVKRTLKGVIDGCAVSGASPKNSESSSWNDNFIYIFPMRTPTDVSCKTLETSAPGSTLPFTYKMQVRLGGLVGLNRGSIINSSFKNARLTLKAETNATDENPCDGYSWRFQSGFIAGLHSPGAVADLGWGGFLSFGFEEASQSPDLSEFLCRDLISGRIQSCYSRGSSICVVGRVYMDSADAWISGAALKCPQKTGIALGGIAGGSENELNSIYSINTCVASDNFYSVRLNPGGSSKKKEKIALGYGWEADEHLHEDWPHNKPNTYCKLKCMHPLNLVELNICSTVSGLGSRNPNTAFFSRVGPGNAAAFTQSRDDLSIPTRPPNAQNYASAFGPEDFWRETTPRGLLGLHDVDEIHGTPQRYTKYNDSDNGLESKGIVDDHCESFNAGNMPSNLDSGDMPTNREIYPYIQTINDAPERAIFGFVGMKVAKTDVDTGLLLFAYPHKHRLFAYMPNAKADSFFDDNDQNKGGSYSINSDGGHKWVMSKYPLSASNNDYAWDSDDEALYCVPGQ